MKHTRIILLIATLLVSGSLFSQSTFGVKGGLSLTTMSGKEESGDPVSIKPGFHIGAVVDFPMSDGVSFETGLFAENKGFLVTMEQLYEDMSSSDLPDGQAVFNLWYLTLPMNFKVTFDLGGLEAYGLCGPYVAYALTGKMTMRGEVRDLIEDAGGEPDMDVEIGYDENNDVLKPFD